MWLQFLAVNPDAGTIPVQMRQVCDDCRGPPKGTVGTLHSPTDVSIAACSSELSSWDAARFVRLNNSGWSNLLAACLSVCPSMFKTADVRLTCASDNEARGDLHRRWDGAHRCGEQRTGD